MTPSCVARQRLLAVTVLSVVIACVVDVHAQDQAQAKAGGESKLGWSNTSDLSVVVTGGNSQSTTLGLSDKLQHVWKDARLEFEVNVVRANKSDDRFFLVEPGLEFPVGGAPSNPATTLIKPDPEPDVANYLIRGGYEKKISARWFWNAGGSWYRNDDAGILNRYFVFAGLGNTWADNPRRRFVTSYGVSYTDREEEEPDPETGPPFGGARAGWDYTEHFNAATTFDSDFGVNPNFSDPSDYSINTLNALTVSVNARVSLKVSLQCLFENEPALEDDLDVIVYVGG